MWQALKRSVYCTWAVLLNLQPPRQNRASLQLYTTELLFFFPFTSQRSHPGASVAPALEQSWTPFYVFSHNARQPSTSSFHLRRSQARRSHQRIRTAWTPKPRFIMKLNCEPSPRSRLILQLCSRLFTVTNQGKCVFVCLEGAYTQKYTQRDSHKHTGSPDGLGKVERWSVW